MTEYANTRDKHRARSQSIGTNGNNRPTFKCWSYSTTNRPTDSDRARLLLHQAACTVSPWSHKRETMSTKYAYACKRTATDQIPDTLGVIA